MRSLFMAAALLISSVSAHSAAWSIFTSAENGQFSRWDPDTLKARDGYLTVWVEHNFAKARVESGKTFKSARMLYVLDCRNNELSNATFAAYEKPLGAGRLVVGEDYGFGRAVASMKSALPSSVGEGLLRTACPVSALQ